MSVRTSTAAVATRKLNRVQTDLFDLLTDNVLVTGNRRATLASKVQAFLGEFRAELGIGARR